METLHAMDQGLLYRFETVDWPWLGPILRGATHLGDPPVLAAAVSLLALAFLGMGRRRAAVCLAGAALLGWGVLNGTRVYVQRPRPDLVWRRVPELPRTWAFPSGHTLESMAIYLTAALLAARRLRPWPAALVIAAALALSVLIGLSRVYLGVHYPLDVVGGWLAGLGCALLACWADG